jgi:hypothetical protein
MALGFLRKPMRVLMKSGREKRSSTMRRLKSKERKMRIQSQRTSTSGSLRKWLILKIIFKKKEGRVGQILVLLGLLGLLGKGKEKESEESHKVD